MDINEKKSYTSRQHATYKPNTIKSSWKYIPNPYGLKVIIKQRDSSDKIEGLRGEYPHNNIPFCVIRKGYAKTILNLINDLVDRDVYDSHTIVAASKLSSSSIYQQKPAENCRTRKFVYRTAIGACNDTTYTIIKRFEAAIEGKKAPMKSVGPDFYKKFNEPRHIVIIGECEYSEDGTLLINSECTDKKFFDINANPCQWLNTTRASARYEADQSYMVIPKCLLHDIIGIIYPMVEDIDLSVHQVAAINYLSAVNSSNIFVLL